MGKGDCERRQIAEGPPWSGTRTALVRSRTPQDRRSSGPLATSFLHLSLRSSVNEPRKGRMKIAQDKGAKQLPPWYQATQPLLFFLPVCPSLPRRARSTKRGNHFTSATHTGTRSSLVGLSSHRPYRTSVLLPPQPLPSNPRGKQRPRA